MGARARAGVAIRLNVVAVLQENVSAGTAEILVAWRHAADVLVESSAHLGSPEPRIVGDVRGRASRASSVGSKLPGIVA